MTRERCTTCISVSVLLLLLTSSAWGNVTLGSFNFNSSQFGDSLVESDGGARSSLAWLNVANSDPGSPGYLTGPNFSTGICNVGNFDRVLSYTIGYDAPIINGGGDDLGVVVARYGEDEGNNFLMAVSADGSTFTEDIEVLASSAVSTGVGKSYYYGGNGPYDFALHVHAIDLGIFDLASISAVRLTIDDELDLIRAAGFGDPVVPVPGAMLLAGLGAALVGGMRRRRSL